MRRRALLKTFGMAMTLSAGCTSSSSQGQQPMVTPDPSYGSFTEGGAWPAVRADDRHSGVNDDSNPVTGDVGVSWLHDLDGEVPGVSAAGAVQCVVTDDRRVFVGGDDGYITAIDGQTGERVWRRRLNGEQVSALRVAADGLYATVDMDHVYRLSPTDGTTTWTAHLDGYNHGGDTVATRDGIAFPVTRQNDTDSHYIQFLDNDGTERWRHTFDDGKPDLPLTRVGDTLVAAVRNHYDPDFLVGFAPSDGTVQWTYTIENTVHAHPLVEPQTPCVVGDLLVLQFDPGNHLRAFSNDGQEWAVTVSLPGENGSSETTDNQPPSLHSPVVLGDRVYYADWTADHLIPVSSTGEVQSPVAVPNEGSGSAGWYSVAAAGSTFVLVDRSHAFTVAGVTSGETVLWNRRLPNRDDDEKEGPDPSMSGDLVGLHLALAHGQIYVASRDSGDIFALGNRQQ